MDIKKAAIERIDRLLTEYNKLRKNAEDDDLSDLNDDVLSEEFGTRALATIEAMAEKDSAYVRNATWVDSRGHSQQAAIPSLVGVLRALKKDLEADYFWQISELIHADIFRDFLEMAEYLLKENYKDPAAVLIGGVLEEHLRKLCLKNNISIEIIKKGKKDFRQAASMNDELRKNKIYTDLEHKSIIAWLDLRNKAAHGRYDEYKKAQVESMFVYIRDFTARLLA